MIFFFFLFTSSLITLCLFLDILHGIGAISFFLKYGKCPRILNTIMSDKIAYANTADPDQTAPDGAV